MAAGTWFPSTHAEWLSTYLSFILWILMNYTSLLENTLNCETIIFKPAAYMVLDNINMLNKVDFKKAQHLIHIKYTMLPLSASDLLIQFRLTDFLTVCLRSEDKQKAEAKLTFHPSIRSTGSMDRTFALSLDKSTLDSVQVRGSILQLSLTYHNHDSYLEEYLLY